MKQFYDLQGELVKFSTQFNQFSSPPRDVLVLTKWDEDWLFTKHKERGIEFPGGKIESGETTEEAARREVYEETGAILSRLIPIAEYQVGQGDHPFVKRVFFGEVERLEEKESYLETEGPVRCSGNILTLIQDQAFSPYMKDDVIKFSYQQLKNIALV